MTTRRNGLTEQQRATALRLHHAGAGITEIIRAVGKSYDCVALFLRDEVA